MKKIVNLVTLEEPNSVHAEMFRSIRTNIEYSSVDKVIKIINVTSSQPDEAKTTTACNLAIINACKYKKVLLVDLDLRNPSVQQIFNLKSNPGLTDMLIDFVKSEDKLDIYKYLNKIEHPNITNELYVLTAGTLVVNPTEILSSKKIEELLTFLKNYFDIIITDSAPSGLIIDGVISSKLSDGTIFIVESGKTKRDIAHKAVEQLQSLGIHILGVVLTKVPYKNKERGYGYGYGNLNNDDRIKINVE